MAAMINDLLDFTGTGLGSAMPLSPAATDLKAVWREVVDEMRAAHPARTLRFHSHGDDPSGQWDAPRACARWLQTYSATPSSTAAWGGRPISP